MRNFRLILAYDGTRYRGWQRLGDSEQTIQGKLEQVISRMVQAPVEVIGSGRTDAGAHAMGQVANFHCDTTMTVSEIAAYLRHYLPEDIGVLHVDEVGERFHSRYGASSKTYQYRIWNSEVPCVFQRKYVWVMDQPLCAEAMHLAAQEFVGTHDFRAFCSNKRYKKSTIRTITSFSVHRVEHELVFTVTGDGFLYNMVRIMIGTLVAVGRGELNQKQIPEIMNSQLRERAGETVPAKGLCLMEVCYQ